MKFKLTVITLLCAACFTRRAQAADMPFDQDYFGGALQAVISENIQYFEGGCSFMTADGYYRVIITPETLVTDENGIFLPPEEIRPGMTMLFWVDMVTASFPAQAYPERVTLLQPSFIMEENYMGE